MKDDTISRAAAIALVEEVESKRLKGEIDLTYAPMIKGIKALPPAQHVAKDINVPVKDCISRAAALTALERDEEYDKDIPNRADGVRDAIITISALPSAQPGWIPVTERLPEYGTTVLTCDHDGEYEINHIIDEEDGEWFLNGAVAWMPIPAPLEGDANG